MDTEYLLVKRLSGHVTVQVAGNNVPPDSPDIWKIEVPFHAPGQGGVKSVTVTLGKKQGGAIPGECSLHVSNSSGSVHQVLDRNRVLMVSAPLQGGNPKITTARAYARPWNRNLEVPPNNQTGRRSITSSGNDFGNGRKREITYRRGELELTIKSA